MSNRLRADGGVAMDARLTLFFDGGSQLCFVQGEDRVCQLCFFDTRAGVPLDLTAATVSVALPASSAGTVRRMSAPLVLAPSAITIAAPGVITYPDHGLVSGDVVQFINILSATLPAPLALATSYTVVATDPNTVTLTLNGVPVTFTTAGSGVFGMSTSSIAIANTPQTGCASLTLSAACTSAINPGQMQDIQANVVVGNKTRICVAMGALSVLEQPEP